MGLRGGRLGIVQGWGDRLLTPYREVVLRRLLEKASSTDTAPLGSRGLLVG
jgi:hypothetical protein